MSAIVALNADRGKYLWHYQTNPGETWDYNSAMDIMLIDHETEDGIRKVIYHEPKSVISFFPCARVTIINLIIKTRTIVP